MRNQFDNYEKRIMEKLDRETEEIERRIGEDPEVAGAKASEALDEKVYAGVAAFEKAVARSGGVHMAGMSGVDGTDCIDGIVECGTGTDADCTDREAVLRRAGLSEKEIEALRLGEKELNRRAEEANRKGFRKIAGRYAGIWKRVAAAAAVLVVVVGVGIEGIGGPERFVEMMGLSIGEREISQGNSSTKDAKILDEERELEAYQQIYDELGIEPVKLMPISKDMRYKHIEIDNEIRLAQMLYVCGGKNISYSISDSYTEELWSSNIGDKKTDEYIYEIKKINVAVTEYELPESGEKEYAAEFEYKGVYYQLTAVLNRGDFEKILKNLYFS